MLKKAWWSLKKLSDEEATKIAKEELAKVGLSDREQHYPRHLSGGAKTTGSYSACPSHETRRLTLG